MNSLLGKATAPLALPLLLCLLGAGTGTTTRTAKTAPPVDVELAGTANQEAGPTGDKDAFARANHVHKVHGVLPVSNGGTGTSSLSCASNQRLSTSGNQVACVNLPGASSSGQPVPPTAETIGGEDSNGNTYSAKVCDASAPIIRAAGSSANLEVIPGAPGKRIYVCGLYLAIDTAAGLGFFSSGDHCTTSVSPVTGTTKLPPNGGYALGLSSFAVPFGGAAGTSLCIATDGPALIGGWISFTQQ